MKELILNKVEVSKIILKEVIINLSIIVKIINVKIIVIKNNWIIFIDILNISFDAIEVT